MGTALIALSLPKPVRPEWRLKSESKWLRTGTDISGTTFPRAPVWKPLNSPLPNHWRFSRRWPNARASAQVQTAEILPAAGRRLSRARPRGTPEIRPVRPIAVPRAEARPRDPVRKFKQQKYSQRQAGVFREL